MYDKYVESNVLVAEGFGNVSSNKSSQVVNKVKVANLSPNELGEREEGNENGVEQDWVI